MPETILCLQKAINLSVTNTQTTWNLNVEQKNFPTVQFIKENPTAHYLMKTLRIEYKNSWVETN